MGGDYNWPSVAQTKEYRAKVRIIINEIIDRTHQASVLVRTDRPM